MCDEAIDWKAAYEAAVAANQAMAPDANRYRFLRDHTYVKDVIDRALHRPAPTVSGGTDADR